MAYPKTLREKTPIVTAVVAIQVPEPPIWTGLREVLDETQGLQMPKLTVKQRQEKLFKELDLSGLESWPSKLADSAWSLLAEYHNIFSLKPENLAVLIQLNMWSKSLTIPHLKNNSNSPAIGGRSPYTPATDVAFRCNLPQPQCVVLCGSVGSKEGWRSTFWYRFLSS